MGATGVSRRGGRLIRGRAARRLRRVWTAPTAPISPTPFATPLDDVQTTLASGYTAGATALVLAPGAGALFGMPTPAHPVRVTLTPAANLDAQGRVIDRNLLASYLAVGKGGDTLTGVSLSVGNDQSFPSGSMVAVAMTSKDLTDVHGAVNALEAAFAGKANVLHSHSAGDVTSGVFAPARLGTGSTLPAAVLHRDNTWAVDPPGGVTVGAPVTSGIAGYVLHVDPGGSGNLVQNIMFQYDGRTFHLRSDGTHPILRWEDPDGAALASVTPTGDFAGPTIDALQARLDDLELGTVPSTAVTGGATLAAGVMGTEVVCSGTAADYVVTLPDAVAVPGQSLRIRMATGTTKLVTLATQASQKINNASTRIMLESEVALLRSDGANWFKVGGTSRRMHARAIMHHGGASFSIPNTTPTQIPIDAADLDCDGLNLMLDLAGHRITVRRPGLYEIKPALRYENLPGNASLLSVVARQNGADTVASADVSGLAGDYPKAVGSALIACAAGDQITMFAYQASGTSQNGQPDTTFLEVSEFDPW